jgi:hypothetical protein
MLRELTAAEKDYWYGRALWPCCKKSGYVAGERVGTKSRRVLCQRCGTQMNVIDSWWWPADKWGSVGPGQMLREPAGYKQPSIPLLRRLTLSFKGKP